MKYVMYGVVLLYCWRSHCQPYSATILFEDGRSVDVMIDELPKSRPVKTITIVDGEKTSVLTTNEIEKFKVKEFECEGRKFVNHPDEGIFIEKISSGTLLFFKAGKDYYVRYNEQIVELEYGTKTVDNNSNRQVVENTEWKYVIKSLVRDCHDGVDELLLNQREPTRALLIELMKNYEECLQSK